MGVEEITAIISAVIAIVSVVISIIIKIKTNQKIETSSISETLLNVFYAVRDAMFGVEDKDYSSEDKHAVAVANIKAYCIENGIDYSKIDLDAFIEFFMEVGNTINKRDETTEDETTTDADTISAENVKIVDKNA